MFVASYGKTDIGLKRMKNEDAFLIKPELGFCLVADGMGGQAAGDLASRIIADTALDVFSKKKSFRTEEEISKTVMRAFIQANESIRKHTEKNPHHEGMGCTAEITSFYDDQFIVGHVGDSRTYCFRSGGLRQLTRDHSFVQNLIDEGIITPEEARESTHRNIILRAVGIEEKPTIDIVKGRMLPGDIYLICTDGLTDMIPDSYLRDVLQTPGSLQAKAEKLIELANGAGGFDNITVVLSQIS